MRVAVHVGAATASLGVRRVSTLSSGRRRTPGRIFGPVVYQPTSFSLAFTFLNMRIMSSLKEWSRNQMFGSLSSSSNGTAKLFVTSTTPLDTEPSSMPTTRFFVSLAVRL